MRIKINVIDKMSLNLQVVHDETAVVRSSLRELTRKTNFTPLILKVQKN